MKTAISIENREFMLNEDAARRHHLTRSRFYAEAGKLYRHHLDEQGGAKVAAINETIARVGQPATDGLEQAATAVFEGVEW